MKANGWEGVRRVKKVRTTVADPAADRAPDLVQRRFRAPARNRLPVADFTYVRMATGWYNTSRPCSLVRASRRR